MSKRVLLRTGLGTLALLAASTTPVRAASSTFVRVNQIGYPSGAAKRAYLMTTGSNGRGVSFSVRQLPSDAVVFSGQAGASLGAWNGRFAGVYPLDFDALRTPGRYVITVGAARRPISSPPFEIGEAFSLYEPALENSLSFYENERDGPEFIPSPLRTAPGHLNDESAMTYATPETNENGEFEGDLESLGTTIDASGGWWDAGDYLEFVQTTSYTVDLQLAGVRDFPAEMGASAGASDFGEEARFGVEWLLRMWNDSTKTLYYQVGIGEGNEQTVGDHDLWRLPQEDDTFGGSDPRYRYIRHRPVFRAGPPGSPVSPNLAGRDAAAFGLCFQVYAQTRPELADRCLHAGEDIFALADTDPRGNLLTTIPFDFYPETQWRDDLELGATELALALGGGASPPGGLPHEEASFYLARAAHWAHEYVKSSRGTGDTLNLYDVSGLADFELVRALRAAGDPGGLETSEESLIRALGGELHGAVQRAHHDPFGFGFGWANADTTSHGTGLSAMASEYDYLTNSSTYAAYANRWLGNVLGANAWGYSLIIGDGSTFPRCPQHEVANIVGSLDGSAPVLAGAAVEGPSDEGSRGLVPGMRRCPAKGSGARRRFDNAALFEDNVQSYTTVEPAIDLTASSMLAFAWQVATPGG
jgi:endoglucanase